MKGDRIGRTWTDTLGLPLDLGASWVHGVEGNPITGLAENFSADTVETDYDNGIVFDANGRKLSDSEYKETEDLFNSIYDSGSTQDDTDDDMPLQQPLIR